MNELTKEEAIAGAARYIERARQSSALAAEEWARAIWDDWFSRVRTAAPPVEVVYGPAALKAGYWRCFADGCEAWWIISTGYYPLCSGARAVYIGHDVADPGPKPAPPMPPKPEQHCYRVTSLASAGYVFWGVENSAWIIESGKQVAWSKSVCEKVEATND